MTQAQSTALASSRRRLWAWRIGATLALAAAVHLLAVWAVPRVIMGRVLSAAQPEKTTGVFLPPMTDASARRIVMPSPDLLYATCAFDVGTRPLRIRADPKSPRYWSIALYADNSDNFFVINDREAAGKPIDIVLIGPKAYAQAPALPAGANVIDAPSARGLLLMRVLVADYAAEKSVVEAARGTLSCEALS
jgi:uncharacterized membrane protein